MMGSDPKNAAAVVLLAAAVLCAGAAGHGDDGDDTGVHKNYLIFVRPGYEYDHGVHQNVSSWHASLLASVCDMAKETMMEDPKAVSRLLYSYRNVVNGFAARLTPQELKEMSSKDWFQKAVPEKTYHLKTTHTPQMLGLIGGGAGGAAAGLWNTSNMGEGIIIGVLDDGLFAGHPSFDGAGMKPPPDKWKGRCDFNKTACNNKVIGARSFFESGKWRWTGQRDPVLPISAGMHGTHTASAAAGTFVPGASISGYGLGTASGMAPRAHIAFYQVCFDESGCDRDDILAAVDEAIEDGVDVLSLSLGGDPGAPLSEDAVALGGYTAMLNGLFVSAAGGNVGPGPSTLANEAPWVLTVGASTTDRRFSAAVKLGTGAELDGESVSVTKDFGPEMKPLVHDLENATCSNESRLMALNLAGKIIVCDTGGEPIGSKGKMVRRAGAAGMIYVALEKVGPVFTPRPLAVPTVHVPFVTGEKVKAYVEATKQGPTANLVFKGTVFDTPQSPMVAPFSSRGPNSACPGILKPDIIGPGVNILAGVPTILEIELKPGEQMPLFDIKSGTSMSTPHLAGVAALIKNAHPTWSSAAIKSALMTTADTLDNLKKPISNFDGTPAGFFDLGAGHVNPQRAMDPGLVYNLSAPDYVPFLCGLGLTDQQVSSIVHPDPPVACAQLPKLEEKDLNYPSITVIIGTPSTTVNLARTVTNVGEAASKYAVEVDAPSSVVVAVNPKELQFKELGEELSYTVTVTSGATAPTGPIAGQLRWVSGAKYVVRSPIHVLPPSAAQKEAPPSKTMMVMDEPQALQS